MTELETLRELIAELNRHTQLYNENKPEWSDEKWDEAYFRLQEMEKELGTTFPNSPTQVVEYSVVNELKKIDHEHEMLSLAKAHKTEEIADFVGKEPWIAMMKLDGLTCSITYQDGKIVRMETRGNGVTGEDILHNADAVSNIPQKIKHSGKLVVDGEIICRKDIFNEYFSKDYANPRNFAAGSIRLLDAKECANRKLTFMAWDCIEGLDNCELLSEKLMGMKAMGFDIVPYATTGKIEEVNKQTQEIAEILALPIDGVVWKWDNCRRGAALGKTSHHFSNGLAFKFMDEIVESELEDIIYDVGRTGVLTPVAIFKPVEISGSVCSKASLHNLTIMDETLGPRPHKGQKVWVEKSNDIIPQIIRADWAYAEQPVLSPPKTCPICGAETRAAKENESKMLYCTNDSCDGKLLNKLVHYCSRDYMDIRGLSEKTLEDLIAWGWITDFISIYYLKPDFRDDWVKKPSYGYASVDKILDAIETSRTVKLDRFIAALGIPLVGRTASKELAKRYKSWDNFIQAVESNAKFYDLPNFGYEMNKAILNFNYKEAKILAENYLTILPEEEEKKSNSLAGKTFVITGAVRVHKNRDQLKGVIEAAGGKVSSSVSNKTSYLICNNPENTTKYNRAKELNLPILTEEELLAMI